jgi:TonB-linked SusC/RagA family outer membrane protein
MAFAQNTSVTGTVTDESGEPLIGVSVLVKGMPTIGASTNINGAFSLSQVPPQSVLVFSYLGYVAQEIPVNNRTTINVQLKEDTQMLEEVVVTAFAVQRRVNVTGAISTVTGNEIAATPVSNISSALVGLAPGISALQMGGEPGRNAADITIRGISTYNGSSAPLIVIDGIEQASERAFDAFDNLDPNEILGISVLKDASSTAVYGIRAANGVIIVTTKRGLVGRPKVSVSSNFGITKATGLQKGLSSHDWAVFRNEGVMNEMNAFGEDLSRFLYTFDDLWKFQNNRDYTSAEIEARYPHLSDAQKQQLMNSPALYYGNSDLYVEQFNRMAPQWQTNVNVSGGTDRVKYFTSLGYFTQESIMNTAKYYGSNTGSKFQRYNFRANIDVDVVKNVTLSVNSTGQFGTTQGPAAAGGTDPYNLYQRYVTIMQYIYDGNPFMAPGIIDNHLISGFSNPAGSIQQELALKTNSTIGAQNAIYNLLTSGTGYIYNTLLDNTIRVKHDMPYISKRLYMQASVNYQDNYNRFIVKQPSIPSYTVRRSIEDPNVLEFFGGSMGGDGFSSSGYSNWNKLYLDAGIYYNETFGAHNLGFLFLGKAYRYTMPGSSHNTPSGNMGLVGRVTYDYKQRYMAEFNMGYNGTEQFAEGNRFGFFPAFSAGWVPSNESFFPTNQWLTFLKLRGSYGEVGNDQIGTGTNAPRYLYLPNTYNLNQSGYYFGSATDSANPHLRGITEGNLGNPNVTWEREKKYDIGIDTRFIEDKLSFTFDYFNNDRSHILTRLGIIPAIYGVAQSRVPAANVGETNNKGYDMLLGWRDRAGGLGYNVEAHMSFARNKIIYRAEAPKPYEWMNETGHMIGQRFGLKSNGLFNTQDDLNARPFNTYNNNAQTLGDIQYLDLNGDGVIDQYDRAPIGYPNRPLYQFGLKLGFNYRGFDLRLLLNGTAKGSFYLSRISIPFYKYAGNAFEWQYNGRWTPEKYAAGEEITYPRATFDADINSHNFMQSDYWMKSNDFLKLKNAELGYTFPSTMRFMQSSGISSLRIYATGNNLYTFINKMRDIGIDPEVRESQSYSYVFPTTTTVTLGFNIQF